MRIDHEKMESERLVAMDKWPKWRERLHSLWRIRGRILALSFTWVASFIVSSPLSKGWSADWLLLATLLFSSVFISITLKSTRQRHTYSGKGSYFSGCVVVHLSPSDAHPYQRWKCQFLWGRSCSSSVCLGPNEVRVLSRLLRFIVIFELLGTQIFYQRIGWWMLYTWIFLEGFI